MPTTATLKLPQASIALRPGRGPGRRVRTARARLPSTEMIEDALYYARWFNQGDNPHFATASGAYGLGIETGVDFDAVVEAGQFICEVLGRKPTSKVAQAIAGRSR